MKPARDPLVLRVAAGVFIAAAAVLLFVLMMVTTIDVIGRYVFSRPLPAASEISQILLGLIIYCALPAACLNQEHIVVGLVFDRLTAGRKRVAGAIVNLTGGAFLALAANELSAHGSRIASYGDATTYLGLPTGPLAQVMAALSLLSAILLFYNAATIATGRKSAGASAETPLIE